MSRHPWLQAAATRSKWDTARKRDAVPARDGGGMPAPGAGMDAGGQLPTAQPYRSLSAFATRVKRSRSSALASRRIPSRCTL